MTFAIIETLSMRISITCCYDKGLFWSCRVYDMLSIDNNKKMDSIYIRT